MGDVRRVSPADYQLALSTAASRRDDRSISWDHRTHWSAVHSVLTKHARAAGAEPVCAHPECGKPWPCEVVAGAVTDLDASPSGW